MEAARARAHNFESHRGVLRVVAERDPHGDVHFTGLEQGCTHRVVRDSPDGELLDLREVVMNRGDALERHVVVPDELGSRERTGSDEVDQQPVLGLGLVGDLALHAQVQTRLPEHEGVPPHVELHNGDADRVLVHDRGQVGPDHGNPGAAAVDHAFRVGRRVALVDGKGNVFGGQLAEAAVELDAFLDLHVDVAEVVCDRPGLGQQRHRVAALVGGEELLMHRPAQDAAVVGAGDAAAAKLQRSPDDDLAGPALGRRHRAGDVRCVRHGESEERLFLRNSGRHDDLLDFFHDRLDDRDLLAFDHLLDDDGLYDLLAGDRLLDDDSLYDFLAGDDLLDDHGLNDRLAPTADRHEEACHERCK